MIAYRVVRKDNGPRNPHTGIVSQHRTLLAAECKMDRLCASLQRVEKNYINPFRVQILESGEWRNY